MAILCKFVRRNAIAGIDLQGSGIKREHIYIERLGATFHLSTRLLSISPSSKVDPPRMSSHAVSLLVFGLHDGRLQQCGSSLRNRTALPDTVTHQGSVMPLVPGTLCVPAAREAA